MALEGKDISIEHIDGPEKDANGKPKKQWKFNPIRTLIINPVGKVLKLPGKLVDAVTHKSSHDPKEHKES